MLKMFMTLQLEKKQARQERKITTFHMDITIGNTAEVTYMQSLYGVEKYWSPQ